MHLATLKKNFHFIIRFFYSYNEVGSINTLQSQLEMYFKSMLLLLIFLFFSLSSNVCLAVASVLPINFSIFALFYLLFSHSPGFCFFFLVVVEILLLRVNLLQICINRTIDICLLERIRSV